MHPGELKELQDRLVSDPESLTEVELEDLRVAELESAAIQPPRVDWDAANAASVKTLRGIGLVTTAMVTAIWPRGR